MFRKEPGLWILEFYYVMNHSDSSSPMSLPHLEDVPRGLPLAALTLYPFTANSQQYWTQIEKHGKVSSWEPDEVGRCQQRTSKKQLSFASSGRCVSVKSTKCCETESTVTWEEGAPNSVFSCTGVICRLGCLVEMDQVCWKPRTWSRICCLCAFYGEHSSDHKWPQVTIRDSCGNAFPAVTAPGVLLWSSAHSKDSSAWHSPPLQWQHLTSLDPLIAVVVAGELPRCKLQPAAGHICRVGCDGNSVSLSISRELALSTAGTTGEQKTWWPSSSTADVKMPN